MFEGVGGPGRNQHPLLADGIKHIVSKLTNRNFFHRKNGFLIRFKRFFENKYSES